MIKKSGRPAKYVQHKGSKVVGLSLKSDGRFYTTHNDPVTGKRKYFGYDIGEAVKSFRNWKKSFQIEVLT